MQAGVRGVTGGAAGAIGAGAAAAALISWTMASNEMGKLENETGLSFGRLIEHLNPFGDGILVASDRMKNMDAVVRRIGDDSLRVDATDAAMKHYIDTLEQSGYAAVAAGDMTLDAFHKVLAQAHAQAEIHERFASAGAMFQKQAAEIAGMDPRKGIGVSGIAYAYEQMSKVNESAADKFARDQIEHNKVFQVALAGVNGTIDDAMKQLKKSAEGSDVDGPNTKLPPINFGPTTMHIHQDFRNVDPDRIALVFRRDITRSATNRIDSKFSGPWGV
jgi:hypothetical protein